MTRSMLNTMNWVGTLSAVVALFCGAPLANANISLDWRPITSTVNVGDVVNVGLYLVADIPGASGDPYNTTGSGNVIFTWNPGFLQLQGLDQTGAVLQNPPWVPSFPSVAHYGLNEVVPPQDGNGLMQYMSGIGQQSVIVPPVGGALLTTFKFLALTPTAGTIVDIPPTGGTGGQTIVYSGGIPNLNIVGTLDSTTIQIVPEPSTLALMGFAGLALIRRRRA